MENRQTENKAYIIGVLVEKKLNFGLSKSGKPMVSGHLDVETITPLGTGVVRVKVMQMAQKSNGQDNPLYKALYTVNQTYKAKIDIVGEEVADTVKIQGSLEDGTYYNTNKGDFVEKVELKQLFIERVPAETQHCCKVAFEGYLSKITPIENGSELEVEIIGIGYQGIAVPVKATIPNDLVSAFQGKYMVGQTATLNIAFLNQVEVIEKEEEVGFGEGLGEKIERTVYKRIIFGGTKAIFEGQPNAISKQVVEQGLAIRENKLQEDKVKAESKTGASMQGGFGVPANGGFTAPTGGTQAGGGFTPPTTGGFVPPAMNGFPTA